MRCKHAWALEYLAHERGQDREWSPALEAYTYDQSAQLWRSPKGAGICTSRERSTALGKAVHGTFERWYEPSRGVPDWRNLPGKIANSACHLLPHPTNVRDVRVERSIGRVSIPKGKPHAPTTVLVVHGVKWGGYRDLAVVPTPEEGERLGWIDATDHAWHLADYKSTADIARYALSTAELETDVQGNLYTIDMCEDFNIDVVPAHWIYLETKKVRRSHATHARMTRTRALDVLEPCADLARELDTYTRVEDAPKNPLACSDYGPPNKINCPHAKVNGGTCEVRRSFGALIQLGNRKKKDEITMALDADKQAKFDKMKADAKAKAAAVAGTTEPDPSDEPATGDDETPPAEVAPAKPVVTAKPKPSLGVKKPVAASGAVGVVLSLHGKLEAAEAKRAAAQADVDAVLSEIKAALA